MDALAAFTFYDEASGEWSGLEVRCTDFGTAKLNAPPGAVTVATPLHPHAKRWTDGALVEYQPPQPSADHEWDDAGKQWCLSAAALEHANRRHFALQRITELERQQARAIREHLLGEADALARLYAIDDEIAALRKDLSP